MKTINENTIIATGKEISNSGLYPIPLTDDSQLLLWIKWDWENKSIRFAPVTELYSEMKEDSTHEIIDEGIYFKLPRNDNRDFILENFIKKHIKVERINRQCSMCARRCGCPFGSQKKEININEDCKSFADNNEYFEDYYYDDVTQMSKSYLKRIFK